MNLRPAESRDHPAIRRILLSAFPDSSEADLVEQLRGAGHAAIELVAEDGAELVGHILFSPMQAPIRALGLAPVSVPPERQNQGIGGALIRRGHEIARAAGWQAIFVLGEPGYYSRLGYSVSAARSSRTAPIARASRRLQRAARD